MKAMTVSFLIGGVETALPVTPRSVSWGCAQGVNQLSLNGTGSVYLPGDPKAHSGRVECMFPAQRYPFCTPGASTDPYYYVGVFQRCIEEKAVVRFVAAGMANAQVLIEEIEYEEKDGSGDVYATLYLKEYRPLEAAATQQVGALTGNASRSDTEETRDQGVQYYTIREGDCLSVICRRYYGKGTARYYNALAKYNGIKATTIIYPGDVLAIPPVDQLGVK